MNLLQIHQADIAPEVVVAIITSAVALTVAGITLFFQARQNSTLERTKAQLQQMDFIHRLQFEKEFSIYEELWKDLFSVHEQLAQYLTKTRSTTDVRILNQLTVDMFRVAQDFHVKVAKNKPFFSSEIYKQIVEFDVIIYQIPIVVYHDKDSDPQKYIEQISKHSQKLSVIMETVSDLIRSRIALPKKTHE